MSDNWNSVNCKALIMKPQWSFGQSLPKYMCIQSPSFEVRIILYDSVLARKLIRTIEIDSNQSSFCVREGIVYDLYLTWNMMVYIDKRSIQFPNDLSMIVIGDNHYGKSNDDPSTTKICPLTSQEVSNYQYHVQ